MKTHFSILFFAFILIACDKDAPLKPNVPDINSQHKSLVQSSNSFGIELLKAVHNEEEPDKNIIISPLSVSTALSMVLNGAVEATKSAIFEALKVTNTDLEQNNQTYRDLIDFLPNVDNLVETNIANSIWYEQNFNVLPEFLEVNQTYFDAEIQGLDFSNPSTKDVINQWVANATQQKIESIIEEISPDHVMFLINAIYFNAPWTKKFKKELTSSQPFYLDNGSTTSVDMMYSAEIEFDYFQNSEVELISLPYGNKDYHFTIILPNQDVGIQNLVSNFTLSQWNTWRGNLTTQNSFELRLPKFELDYGVELNIPLTEMGMGLAFAPGMADFSKISTAGQLFISEVVHKTYMKVDEEGTEAAAATSVGVGVTSAPPAIVINRPFLLLIHEQKTGAILFMGKIMNPNE